MKTVNDLYQLGMTDPVVHSYLELVERKEMTLEQALIGMVFTLRDQKNEVTTNYVNHLHKCPNPYREEENR